ncbi:ABC transporter ATP-binding protein [Pseudomonas vanderleydeniana]|uniref:ABC transporter ATP-binding protein n=1 Tax=Pseudomonas vanderleydeniana TaxID=2745495 RepID=A0A9E6PSQ6_9PSED|nr:ABC transporter ATP-binding protein [Pseudomonas vanderleydeniana]QXI31336.1 ABC transporter ATP-binding protein [Pseudomonas vanderleydeniana]
MNAIAQHLPPTETPLHSGALEIRGLSKTYRIEGKPLPVLADIDLSIRPGEFISIVGASGCGKSSLLRLIVGLEADYEGEIRLDGKPVTGTSLERGIVFQDHRLFPWMTVGRNIALALKNHPLSQKEKDQLVAEHIALVNLEGFENAYPHQLSGGMAQRAAIARALVNKPKVLLLDEPLGALDALTRVRLQHELQSICVKQRCTVIMVTHDIEEALYLGDRVIVMDARPGRIKHEISIELPHPRDRASGLLQAYKEQLLAELVH